MCWILGNVIYLAVSRICIYFCKYTVQGPAGKSAALVALECESFIETINSDAMR